MARDPNWKTKSTILYDDGRRRCLCDHFDAEKMVRYKADKIRKLLADPGIVRNRLKVAAFVTNARAYLDLREREGSFNRYLWKFTEGRPILNRWKSMGQIPVSTVESDAMSKDLKQRGFKFTGTTICYAFMQGIGMVDDHLVDCWVKPGKR